ncbi:hypothetical protein GGF31_006442 [Allomyces arbusculus]|nr:hypothetical protein GGF31_006442 [Allomyces arbusculus]
MPAHDASAPPAGTSRAFVKCVLSGDSLVLKESATSPPASERTVSLAYLVSPRLASSKRGQANDEPYAYDARETMRRVLVGKDIALRVDYSNPTTGREFCSVYAMSPKTREWVNVALLSLQRGCVKLRDEPPRSALPIDYALLQEAQRRAQEARTGLWSDKSPPAITLIQTTDPAAFVKQYKGQTLTGIVEHVRDGGCVKIRVLLDNGHTHHFLWTTFSGIKAPMLKPQGSDAPEPYAEAARDFVEARLLQREVQLLAEDVVPGPNTSNGVLATVLHPVGNIAHFLLREGLAKVHDWTAAAATGGPAPLRAAEQYAKDRRLNLWADYTGPAAGTTNNGAAAAASTPTTQSATRFSGTVTRILGPDVLQVRSNYTNTDIKLWLSSVRAPRREGPEAGYVHVAREWLRTRAIGKQVDVHVDYTRAAQGEFDARTCATVTLAGADGTNLAVELIAQGLACVQRPRRGEEDQRARDVDAMIAAEAAAQAAGKGVHSGKPAPPAPRINDVSETPAKARQFLPFLQRAGAKRVHAVAEHVVNGSRLRVVIPRESAKLAVVLAGIRVPRQGEPGAEEALALTSSLAMQRDVQIEVDAVDKTGAFIATVHVPDAQGKMKNLAVALLEAGWASIHEYSADQSAYGNQLYAAERSAKADKAGLWAFEEDEDEDGAEAAAKEAAKKLEQMSVADAAPTVTKNLAPVTVSEIVTAAHFYLQSMAPDAVANLENMMAQFAAYHASPAATATAAPSPLKAGDHVSAKFTADNQWYRARVRKVFGNGTATVVYYDYGNVETVPVATHIRALPAQFTKLPPQAQEARLAYVRAPTSTGAFADDAADALDRLRDLTEGKKLIANLDLVKGGTVWVTLFDPATARPDAGSPIGLDVGTSINADLLADGYVVLDTGKSAAPAAPATGRGGRGGRGQQQQVQQASDVPQGPRVPQAFVDAFQDAMDEARRDHRGIWRYGEVDLAEI